MKNLLNKIPFIILFLVCFAYVYTLIKGKKIENHGKTIIAKMISYKIYPKQETATFIFYNKSKELLSATCVVGNRFSKNNGKFYKCKWLEEYPEALHPIYKEEVQDTIEILEAGFSREDIIGKKVKKIDYFPKTEN